MANWDETRKEWETSKITLAALAEKHDVKLGTLKSRKSREGWSRDPTKKVATKSEKVATKKKGAPVGNSNGKGNKGNKSASPPKQNSNALKHGFYAKHLPEEFLEIMDEVRRANPIDLIWEQIVIQYTAIMDNGMYLRYSNILITLNYISAIRQVITIFSAMNSAPFLPLYKGEIRRFVKIR